jgi:hypothetical protein
MNNIVINELDWGWDLKQMQKYDSGKIIPFMFFSNSYIIKLLTKNNYKFVLISKQKSPTQSWIDFIGVFHNEKIKECSTKPSHNRATITDELNILIRKYYRVEVLKKFMLEGCGYDNQL